MCSVPIEGKHVLIVEDIVDSGVTLQKLVEMLKSRNPASLECVSLLLFEHVLSANGDSTIFKLACAYCSRICCLLRKPECLKVKDLNVKYVGVGTAVLLRVHQNRLCKCDCSSDIPNKWVVGYGLDCAEKWRCVATYRARAVMLACFFFFFCFLYPCVWPC